MQASKSIQRLRWGSCGALVLALGACASDKTAPRSAASVPMTAASQQTATDRAGEHTMVQVSPDIRARCNLPEGPSEGPRFEADQATLRARGEDVLDAVASCLTTGALKGQKVTLIGRADPRGSDGYNQSLGANRANAARNYLLQRGVSGEQIALVSRGERDARGTNEATWALDRRVDIELGVRKATAPASAANSPILEGMRLQIETSEGRTDPNSEASSYADTAEGAKPVSGSSSSTDTSVSGSASSGTSVSGSVSGETVMGPAR